MTHVFIAVKNLVNTGILQCLFIRAVCKGTLISNTICLPYWKDSSIVLNRDNMKISEKQACLRREVMGRIE